MIEDRLFIREDGFQVKVYDISSGKMEFIKKLKNVGEGKCGNKGFYVIEKNGKVIRKYDSSFDIEKEKKLKEKIVDMEIK